MLVLVKSYAKYYYSSISCIRPKYRPSLLKKSGRYHLWNLNLQRPVTVLWPTSLCYLNREHRASPSRQEALFCTPFFSLTDNRMALIRRLQRRRAFPRVLGSRDPYQKLTTFYCNSFEISFLITATKLVAFARLIPLRYPLLLVLEIDLAFFKKKT
jgi:hypothetical protein